MTMRVTLSIVPFGCEEEAYEIGRLDIFNKGTVSGHLGFVNCAYGVINLSPDEEGLYDAEVIHYRPDGGWKLVKKAIEELDIDGPQ